MNAVSPIVELRHVTKAFGRLKALDDVSMTVCPGRIIGLLGANGSGKSTLLRHIIGAYLPDYGACLTFGREAGKLRAEDLGRIGYVHQEGELVEWMKAGQLIRYVSAYYSDWNRDLEARYIREFEIDRDARVGKLSPGQCQRLAILLAICFEPELLILDEPAAALDPLARAQFLDVLLQIIQNSARTIIISSHILSDVEKVIDHVLILKAGRLIRDCGFDELREEFGRVRLTSLNGDLPAELPFTGIVECRRNGKQAVLTLHKPVRERVEEIAGNLKCEVEFRGLTLEELYKFVVTRE
jgi:ABC-2 type transport system ATP-binding protein